MVGKVWHCGSGPWLVAGGIWLLAHVQWIGKQRKWKMVLAQLLLFPPLFYLVWNPSPRDSCPHSGWVFPLQGNLSGKGLRVTPRGVSPRDFEIQ